MRGEDLSQEELDILNEWFGDKYYNVVYMNDLNYGSTMVVCECIEDGLFVYILELFEVNGELIVSQKNRWRTTGH